MSSDQVLGLFRAIVANNADPLNETRVTLYIPQILGDAESAWAVPSSPTNRVPDIGQTLWAQFSGGDITKPIYGPLGLMEIDASQIKAGGITADRIDATELHVDAANIDGTLVADQLDANAINGKTITGATIQTASSGPRIVMNSSSFIGYGTGGNKIGIEPNNAYPYIYWTSDDGTNQAVMNVSGGASDANVGINSGTFVDSADSLTYKWRTYYGNDFWVAERVKTSDLSANGARLFMNKNTVQLTSGSSGSMTLQADSGIRAQGVFRADNISKGKVTITPVANTPTSVTLSGGSIAGTNFYGYVTANTSVPGTQVTGVGCTSVSSAGMVIWITRTNTTNTVVSWMIVGED